MFVPQQYVAGNVAPFIVGADGPDPMLFTTRDGSGMKSRKGEKGQKGETTESKSEP